MDKKGPCQGLVYAFWPAESPEVMDRKVLLRIGDDLTCPLW